MIEKKYECEVITPMFMSGANQQKFELRPPSINGLLRFWWRASSKISDIDKLRKKEGKIFGSKEKKSKLAIKSSLLESDIKKVKNFKGIFKCSRIARKYSRKCLSLSSEARFSFVFLPSLTR